MSALRRQSKYSWFVLLTACLLMADGQQQQSRSAILRSMSQVRSATIGSATPKPEEVDRASSDSEMRPSLTIQPEDRLKLRQSVMELNKRRRVTAIKPTMSPDVISTPNVYHFFAKKRFERVRINSTRTTTESSTVSTTASTTATTPTIALEV